MYYSRSSLTNLYSPLSAPLKDDPGGGPSLDSASSRLSDGEGEDDDSWSDKADSVYLPYHPKPAAVGRFTLFMSRFQFEIIARIW